MKILHLIRSMNPADGGPVEGLRQLARINRAKGIEVEVVCLDEPKSGWIQQSDIKIWALGPSHLGVYGFCPALTPWLRNNVQRFDCIIINGIWNYNGFGAWLVLRNARVPYFVFTHGMLDPYFKRKYPLKHLKKWLYWPWGVYPLLRDAAGVVFTCETERKLARESFWLYKCSEIVIKYGTAGVPHPGHDYRAAFWASHPSLIDKRIFLFLGRVDPKKGPDILIESVGELLRKGDWDPVVMRLVIAGPADSAYARELKGLASREGVADSIYWTGMVLGDQKWGAMQAAEVFVLTSHQENFGIAVAEALSCGTPVLITHPVNISPEIGADGAGLVETDTREGSVRLIQKWLNMPLAAKNKMRQQTTATFKNRYTSEQSAIDLISKIRNTISPDRR